jgi:hypothetical protein
MVHLMLIGCVVWFLHRSGVIARGWSLADSMALGLFIGTVSALAGY